MAIDETLLESALHHGVCTVRLYEWGEPTVSLGYFQPAQDVTRHPVFSRLAAVRRLSGGGAILHDRELTYSCAVPAGREEIRPPQKLYSLVHCRIIETLAGRGVMLAMRGETKRESAEPFLCFGRGDEHDIVLEGHKVLGSAQRRRRGAVVQHGSLLLAASEHAPQFPGICDLSPGFSSEGLSVELAEALGGLFGSVERCELTETEQARATELLSRYEQVSQMRLPN